MEVSRSLDLESILRDNGMSKETLKRSTTKDHRNKIAQKIGRDWESLATIIGVPSEDVYDIKEEYGKPLDRRLAMMRRWHELWGEEATYLKLVEGLRQIGRRDLIIEYVVPANCPCSDNQRIVFSSELIKDIIILMVVFVSFVLFDPILLLLWHRTNYQPSVSDYHNNITSIEQNQANITIPLDLVLKE